jgi:SAM-dependent methyltransferase
VTLPSGANFGRVTPEAYLRSRGLEPLPWDEVLRRIEARLAGRAAPGDSETFARLHRAFVAYPAESTARAFYDLAAREGLHPLLASHRLHRLKAIAETLAGAVPHGARVLDFGAGGGFLAGYLRDALGAEVAVADLSPVTGAALAQQGFISPAPADRFDFILCADSLGEIHADEDDWLSDPGNGGDEGFAGELDARYGFAHKLATLRPRLAPGGAVLLFEPVALEHFWRGAARALVDAGWKAEIRGPEPVWHLRLTLS